VHDVGAVREGGPSPVQPGVEALVPPEVFPVSRDPSEYTGSPACAPCHRQVYATWAASEHGLAMDDATPRSVLADFGAPPLAASDGRVVFSREGDRFWMTMEAGGASERRTVDLVLGSGRQHQVYLSWAEDGRLQMLPAIWLTASRRFIPSSRYVFGELSPASPAHWHNADLLSLPCLNCHVGAVRYELGVDKERLELGWVELPIGCEACHGPGRQHVDHRRQGVEREDINPLNAMSAPQEALVCGQCHGNRRNFAARRRAGWPDVVLGTLASRGMRPDGTQRNTIYQFSGHVLSKCYQPGGMQCRSCHDPHSGSPRALDGSPADGPRSDEQCVVCHRNYLDPAARTQHSHHEPEVRCIDCHMGMTDVLDDRRLEHRTADHSIPIPRPRETLELGIPNACNTCHRDKSPSWSLEWLEKWGQRSALDVRDWVRAVHLARQGRPGVTQELIRLLKAPDTSEYVRVSALTLLATARPEAGIVEAIQPLAEHAQGRFRAPAFYGLVNHDTPRWRQWLRQALVDDDPFVALLLLPSVPDVQVFDRHLLDRLLRHALEGRQRPSARDLVQLAVAHVAREELDQAVMVAGLAARYATAAEARRARLDEARALIEELRLRLATTRARPQHAPGAGTSD